MLISVVRDRHSWEQQALFMKDSTHQRTTSASILLLPQSISAQLISSSHCSAHCSRATLALFPAVIAFVCRMPWVKAIHAQANPEQLGSTAIKITRISREELLHCQHGECPSSDACCLDSQVPGLNQIGGFKSASALTSRGQDTLVARVGSQLETVDDPYKSCWFMVANMV